MTLSIEEVRKNYPQYNAMSDRELADALHTKYYSKVPKQDFYKRIGMKPTRKATTGEFLKSLAVPSSFPEEAEHTIPQSVGSSIWNKFGETGRGILQRLGVDEGRTAIEQEQFDKLINKSKSVNPKSTAAGGILGSIAELPVATAAGGGNPIVGMGLLGGAQYTRPGESALKNAGVNAALGSLFQHGPKAFKFANQLTNKGVQKLGVPQNIANNVSGPLTAGGSAALGTGLANEYLDTDIDPLKTALGAGALYAGGAAGAKAAIPHVSKAIEGTKKFFKKTPENMGEEILEIQGITPAYREKLIKSAKVRQEAAKKADFKGHLHPEEATGSPVIAQNVAEFGKSKAGKGIGEEYWHKAGGGRIERENAVVDKFFESLGVDAKNVPADTSRKLRDTAIEIVEDQLKSRKDAAAGLYNKAYKDKITKKAASNLLEDEVIFKAANSVHKDEAFREALKGINKNSIEYWDIVKKFIDNQVRDAGPEKARLLLKSKNKLLEELDRVSPTYKKARATFSSESKVLEELTNTNLGKLSKLPDTDLHKIGNIIFNRAEIDPKTLDIVRSNLLKKDPKVFYNAVAQDMRLKMDTAAAEATERNLPAFYNAIFRNKKNYNTYKDALKHDPKALERMEAIKVAFKHLATTYTPKAIRKLEETGMTQSRNALKAGFMKLFRSGNGDEAGMQFITNPKWFDMGEKILKHPPGIAREIALVNLLNKIAQSKEVKEAMKLANKHGAAALQEPVRKGINKEE